MSWLRLSVALMFALMLPTASIAAPHIRHHRHYHARLVGPGIGVGPTWDLYGDNFGPPPVYEGPYAGPVGELYGRESGGVNSMSNDFGTSGVLGHANGMPVTGH